MGNPQKDDRAALTKILERINRAHGVARPEPGTPEMGDYWETSGLEHALKNLIAGRRVALPERTYLVARRDGNRVIFREEAEHRHEIVEQLLNFLQLVDAVGVDRVRQCKLPGCLRWFIAQKAQGYCTLAHGNRGSYLAWKARQAQKPRRPKK